MVSRTGRALLAVITALAMVLAMASCSSGDDSDASRAVKDFADAVSRQDTQAAADLTTSPSQAAESLGVTFAGMHPKDVSVDTGRLVEYSDGSASFTLKTTWKWAGDRTFETKTSGSARQLSSGWKVQWDPGLLYTGLTADGRLQEIRTDATPAPTVRTAAGKPLMQMEPVNEITIDPAATKDLEKSVRALVAAVAPVAPMVTAKAINDKLVASQGQPVVAVTLRDADMQQLDSDPSRIAGVNVNKSGMLVMSDRRLSTPLSSGLTNYWNAIRDATAGWQVQLVAPGAPPQQLAGHQGGAGPDVQTTVDPNEQLTLGDAVVEVAQPATMMTVDASTGAIRAMAQNDAAAARNIEAGVAYPVGTTLNPVFDAVDAAGKGSDQKSAEPVLHSLGLGLTFTVPGMSLPSGTTPKVSSAAYHPTDYTASMLNMAALGVALERSGDNDPAQPYVIKGSKTKVTGGEMGKLDDAVVRQIRASMETTAKTGDASDLTKAPGLRALVGTNGPQGPGWFVGSQGGEVIVIYCEGEKSGTAALQVAQKYFTTR
ncbi:NTF2-like N-terminal transpeptidase domain-containing protein [Gordonia neofelifaecis]|uniref:NTF2 domain-containing protein transpeptidase n=1 Tax=Gordonia neofelifaecis NRRL B-59395 TaxID=644548 RepID=F1YKE3_9ACTN|nr:NTF2-like N-terminal transpeptidase domain-containing protein [Gordonia neofelifaecis]EGD54829.1 NTF2 domain-containing protein transpeptidase [Gordonia neofelifaecis NRRL B-59395]